MGGVLLVIAGFASGALGCAQGPASPIPEHLRVDGSSPAHKPDAALPIWLGDEPSGNDPSSSSDSGASWPLEAGSPTVVLDAASRVVADAGPAGSESGSDAAPPNHAPVARVAMVADSRGGTAEIEVGERLSFDGTASNDPDGDPLTYAWTLSVPMGSSAILHDATTDTASFVPDVAGLFEVTLSVSDGTLTDTASESMTANAVERCLLISEYAEGSSFNKAIELFNCGGSAIGLDSYGVCLVSNDDTSCSTSLMLRGPLGAGDVLGICNARIDASLVPAGACDETSNVTLFNGDDRVFLFHDINGSGGYDAGDALIDAFGVPAERPSSAVWSEVDYRRCSPDPFPGRGAFVPASYYRAQPADDFSDLGVPPALSGC